MFTKCITSVIGILLAGGVARCVAETPSGQDDSNPTVWDEATQGPLSHVREGGTPPVDPNQAVYPYAIRLPIPEDAPTSGLIESPPEYAPAAGVLFRYSQGSWPSVVRDCVVALTADPVHDEIAYVVVSNGAIQSQAEGYFAAGGADMSKVQFIQMANNSIWLRDYGPHFIRQNGALGIVDSHYYPTRPLDNFVPTRLADDYFLMPSYDIGLYYSGGNFQPGPNRTGYTTSLTHQDNPGFGEDFIGELYQNYQGIDALHIFPRLPSSVDGTGHIDMWFYLVDEDTVIISEFLPGSNASAIAVTNNAADYMENELGFEVFRVPDHNGGGGVHYTYTNAFRVNDRIFIPTYGEGSASHLARDAEALATWQAAAPGVEIVPINCYSIIPAAGAIHCIVMQVPRHEATTPSAHIVSPDGGELLIGGTTQELLWAASDDEEVTSVDLYYSLDGGETFGGSIASGEVDDGAFAWTIPAVGSSEVLVKAVAHDGAGNSVDAISDTACRVAHARQHVYDFSSGAGVDKWAYGYQTFSWSSLNGVRRPAEAATEISNLDGSAYDKISTSNATGSDFDTNRYRSPAASGGRESTHIFEFLIDEDRSQLMDLEILWEGYGDDCLQVELYVWDYVAAQWGDGGGLIGENRFMDNAAANRDAILSGHIQADFDRYVAVGGLVTVLLYAERSSQESMHDYVSVTTTYAYDGDFDHDGARDLSDFAAFHACVTDPGGTISLGCDDGDLDADADVDFADFAAFQRMFDGP